MTSEMAAAMRLPFLIGLNSPGHWLVPCDRQEGSGCNQSCRSLTPIRQKSGFHWWCGWKMRTRIDLPSDRCEQNERCAPRRRDFLPAGLRFALWNNRSRPAKFCRPSDTCSAFLERRTARTPVSRLKCLPSHDLKLVVVGYKARAGSSSAAGSLSFFAQEFVEDVLANRARTLFRNNRELFSARTIARNTHQHFGVPFLVRGGVMAKGRVSRQFRLPLGIELRHLRDDILRGWKWIAGLCGCNCSGGNHDYQRGKNVLDDQFHTQNSNTNLPWKVRPIPLKNSPKR